MDRRTCGVAPHVRAGRERDVDVTDSPPARNEESCHPFGLLIRSRPASYSTRVCWAAVTSAFLAGSVGRTSTTVSVRSPAASRMSPTPTSKVRVMGSGVSNVGMAVSLSGLAGPARVALAALWAAAGGGDRRRPVQRRGGGPDEPAVDREPLAGGGLLDAGLQLVRQAEVDPRHPPPSSASEEPDAVGGSGGS